MSASELLGRLRALDVQLHVEGGRLRVNAPKGRITPELQAELVAGRDELLRALSAAPAGGAGGRAAAAPALTPAPRDGGPLPLSSFQERLWVVDRLQPGLTAYNLAAFLRSDVALDAALLERAARRVVARHEILRTRFVADAGVPGARVGAPEDVPVVVRDLRGLDEGERWRVLEGAAAAAAHTPFALADEPPVRFTVFRGDDARAGLLVSAHHIALDSWSMALLVGELRRAYADEAAGRPPEPPPALQYADFARWQRALADDPGFGERLAYWTRRLAGAPQLSVFPPDRARVPDAPGRGATHELAWGPEVTAAVRLLARECRATPYMVLLAAVAALLARHTAQTDLVLGSPLGTRERPELETMLGPIVNSLALRFDLSDDPPFGDLVARARDELLEGHARQDVPFERVVQALNPDRSLGQSPLFQVAVVLHNAPDAGGVSVTGGGAVHDLTLFAHERGGALGGSLEYRADLYDEATVARLGAQLGRLLVAAAADPARRASALEVLDDAERALVLEGFNAARGPADPATVVAQFRRRAAAAPDAVAASGIDGALTYAELDRRSDALAARLGALGAGPGRFVALAVERGAALPLAALGIMKAGAAYVPLDLAYPRERLAHMLRDSGARQVVTSRALAAALAPALAGGVEAVIVEDAAAGAPAGPVPDGPAPGDVAYMIYTSGSTGTPKGVVVAHDTLSNLLAAMAVTPGFGADDVMLAVVSSSFDVSVSELFLPLVRGGRVAVADREAVADGARLAALVASSGATMLQSTPSGWRLLQNAGWGGDPRLVAVAAGEPVPADLVAWLRPRVRALWNGYGPTEATVYTSFGRLEPGEPVTIGRPLLNVRAYVLDRALRPAPVGALGELWIGGAAVARGYHARPELTAERFVADPFVAGGRMYRSGDLARWRADGTIDYLGRADGQVKLRGYRIETGEIEAALAAHEFVRAAAVGVRALAADDPRLVAWVQFEDDEECTASELRQFLRRRLPDFMVPALFVPVERWPLTPNGKVDRGALPDPFAGARRAPADEGPPATPTERLIADVWTRLLGVPRVGVADRFFDLGGHSLLAMRAAGEISARTGRAIEPRLLFMRTLGQLAEACDAARAP